MKAVHSSQTQLTTLALNMAGIFELETRLLSCKRLFNATGHRFFRTSGVRRSKESDAKYSSPLKALLDDSASFEDAKRSKQQQWATLPYLDSANMRKQGEYFKKVKKDPRDSSLILFPGQGAQFVGMARHLQKFPMVRDLFELANYILEYDLLEICLKGPAEKLNQTKYSQPAIFVTSLAAIEKLKEERPNAVDNCIGTAGFSVGELTALVFAGAIEFERGNYN